MISLVYHGKTFNFDDGHKAYHWALSHRPEWFSGLPESSDKEWLDEIEELNRLGKLSSFMTVKKKSSDTTATDSILKGIFNENLSEKAKRKV